MAIGACGSRGYFGEQLWCRLGVIKRGHEF